MNLKMTLKIILIPDSGELMLGDIVVSVEKVVEQAEIRTFTGT